MDCITHEAEGISSLVGSTRLDRGRERPGPKMRRANHLRDRRMASRESLDGVSETQAAHPSQHGVARSEFRLIQEAEAVHHVSPPGGGRQRCEVGTSDARTSTQSIRPCRHAGQTSKEMPVSASYRDFQSVSFGAGVSVSSGCPSSNRHFASFFARSRLAKRP